MATLTRRVLETVNTVLPPTTSNATSPLYQNTSAGQYNFNATPSLFDDNGVFQGTSSPVYGGSQRDQYDLYTSAFGILASHYSSAITSALSKNISDLYGTSLKSPISSTSGKTTVNAYIDVELSARQATVGSDFYYRKLGQDLVSPNSDAAKIGINALSSIAGKYTKSVAPSLSVKGVSITPVSSGLKPNISNYGAKTFSSLTRLAPVGYKGAFSSPRYRI